MATPNFGTVKEGHHPKSYGQYGLLTIVTNYTGLTNYLDPNVEKLYYWEDASCDKEPVSRCNKNKTLEGNALLCLAITNPQSSEVKFSLSISFTLGYDLPELPPETTSTTSSTTAPPTSTNTKPTLTTTITGPPPFYATNGINNNYNNNYSIWWVSMLVGIASTVFTLLLL